MISEITLQQTVLSCLLLKAQPEKTAVKTHQVITATEHSSVMHTAWIKPQTHSGSVPEIMSTDTHFLLLETLHYYHNQQLVIRAVDLLAKATWKEFMKIGSHAGSWDGKSLFRDLRPAGV